ncbi:endonuclease/exonuclease/phosphatase family protein [Agromyces sp. SYSU T00194]|uniref:endonuclease/exonuclease/phosphatase family protein n=1 Tax=Agromyces chitinivorans TaxID=3158560 RepID=UPI0033990FB1
MTIDYSGVAATTDPVRTSERLLRMRRRLRDLHDKRTEGSLMLATWNIRDFDGNRFGWGPRLPETFYYLAELCSCFDLIAVQEVNDDLAPLERLVAILGPGEWDWLVTDVTEGRAGNGERMAFLYRRSRVTFRHIAGEIVLPDGQLIVGAKQIEAAEQAAEAAAAAAAAGEQAAEPPEPERRQQFARSPFLVAFQAGWFKFSLCTVHIYYGDESGAQLQHRVNEIAGLVDFFADRQDDEARERKRRAEAAGAAGHDTRLDVENYILLGDFNVVSPEHRTMDALERRGFVVPEQIRGDAITDRDHFYDQIAVRTKDERFRVLEGGVVDMFADVFGDDDQPVWGADVTRRDGDSDDPDEVRSRYQQWRTWQLSDHSPLWIRIDTDFADEYLESVGAGG